MEQEQIWHIAIQQTDWIWHWINHHKESKDWNHGMQSLHSDDQWFKGWKLNFRSTHHRWCSRPRCRYPTLISVESRATVIDCQYDHLVNRNWICDWLRVLLRDNWTIPCEQTETRGHSRFLKINGLYKNSFVDLLHFCKLSTIWKCHRPRSATSPRG